MNWANLATWFLVFLTYAVVGWCMEVVVCCIEQRKAINRGFLIGPVCPIYGYGALIMTLLLQNVENIFVTFIVAFLAGAVIEYFTSYFMEKLFHVRWWDYSKRAFNIHGRICLANLIAFGVLGVIVVRVTNPVLFGMYNSWDVVPRIALAGTLFVIMIADYIITLILINKFRLTVGIAQRDATEELTERVMEILMGKGKLSRRLVKAFPDLEAKKKVPRKRKTKSKNKT